MGDLIDSIHNETPKKASEINTIPKGVKINPRKMGITGTRILIDKVLASMDGIGLPHLESLGISLRDIQANRQDIESVFASIIRNEIKRPMRQQACTAAIRLGGHLKLTGLVPVLQNVLTANHEEPTIRAAAADSLGLMRSKASVPLLTKYMKDPQPLVANAVITAIGKTGQAGILPTLRDLIAKSKDPAKVKCLTLAINRIEKREKIPATIPPWKKPVITGNKQTTELKIEITTQGKLVVK
jgi:hypothetical protein